MQGMNVECEHSWLERDFLISMSSLSVGILADLCDCMMQATLSLCTRCTYSSSRLVLSVVR